jgi:hypothetical protein
MIGFGSERFPFKSTQPDQKKTLGECRAFFQSRAEWICPPLLIILIRRFGPAPQLTPPSMAECPLKALK